MQKAHIYIARGKESKGLVEAFKATRLSSTASHFNIIIEKDTAKVFKMFRSQNWIRFKAKMYQAITNLKQLIVNVLI